MADELLDAASDTDVRPPDHRQRVVRAALDRHALACSRMINLIEELDSYSFVDPIRIVETDLRAR